MVQLTSLTRDSIAAEALFLLDEEGLNAFSTRKLGARLGVEAMALYHHFPSKKHLLDEVVARLLAPLALPPETNGWRAWMGQVARAYRAVGLAHPNVFVLLATRRFDAVFFEAHLRVLTAAGFSVREAARMTRILGAFVNGVVQAEIAAHPEASEHERLADHPLCREAMIHCVRPDMDGVFERGLTMIFDGIARALHRARDSAPATALR